jgi:hypothetical protein
VSKSESKLCFVARRNFLDGRLDKTGGQTCV